MDQELDTPDSPYPEGTSTFNPPNDQLTIHGFRLRGTPDPEHPERVLPAGYVREHVELGYARTVYGAQGETVGAAHLAVGDNTGAASAYVAMTRGRDANTAHLVAESVEDARGRWMAVFGRDRADLGPRQAAHRAGEDLDRYGSLE